MHDEFNKTLLFRAPLLILGVGLIAPLLAHGTLHEDMVLGLAATGVLTVVTVAFAALGRRIARNARVGVGVFVAGGTLTLADIALDRFPMLGAAPVATLAPLAIVVAFLAAATDPYGAKKRKFPALFDGIGIGLSFMLSLCLLSSLRNVIGGSIALGAPGIFLNSAAGIFFLAAGIAFAIGLLPLRKKRGSL